MEILQHRSYRTIIREGLPFWAESIVLLCISIISIYLYIAFFYNQFIEYFYQILLQNEITEGLISLNIYYHNLLVVDVPFLYNSPITLWIVLIGLVLGIFILIKQKMIPLNVVFWIAFLMLLMSIFIVYFIFFSASYPYSAEKYFDLYLHAYIGFMLMCFVALSFILALTPGSFMRKLIILLSSIGYYFLYSFVRLACTVLLVSQVSVAFSPLMYFTIFYDFILIIYIYTIILYEDTQKTDIRRP
ncbi:MAG: hypothetical protein HKP62_09105 [Sulfurovum sp.]|nr:hypothetical protein [Sulfurovum sp.]MBT8349576.1 hypothetical protein [Sulfurovum sp.]NNJ46156.1 hypothetical protein [Sulfurovum sp.]